MNNMEITQTVWTSSKLLVKAAIIGGIVLALQLPVLYVMDLVRDREQRQKEAVTEVSSKWAKKQNLAGPVLVLPYLQNAGDSTNKSATKHYACFLPDLLNISSTIKPEEKYRGIYKVMLYTSVNHLAGEFNSPAFDKLKISPESIIWDEAFVHLNISDPKGLNEEVKMNWNSQTMLLSTDGVSELPFQEGLNAPLNLTSAQDLKHISFSTDISLSGSEKLMFTPLGKSTSVEMSAKWPHPSFTGDILPLNTRITNDSFFASWKTVAQKRNFPQQWKDNAYVFGDVNDPPAADLDNNLASSAFGAELYMPVNAYQKTMRSVKYSLLCILLTFAAFFLIETSNKKSIHPFQYGLIGLALVLFYTLLLSFSEYVGFNGSYVIASLCTITLIAWFVKSIIQSFRLSAILSVVLVLIYTYVFTILQLQDYALILGSVGLFITLAVIMHFSKKIQW
jgi:inner membrane protein